MDSELKKLENELSKLEPLGLPEDLISRLDEAMCRWHQDLPLEEKIIHFKDRQDQSHSETSKTDKASQDKAQTSFPLSWPAVAAVALLGGALALYLPYTKKQQNLPLATAPAPTSAPAVAPTFNPQVDNHSSRTVQANFSPVGSRNELVAAADRGIHALADGQPVRCLTIQYNNQAHYKNNLGQSLEINQPHTKVIVIPLRID